jgi:hypothetical protein
VQCTLYEVIYDLVKSTRHNDIYVSFFQDIRITHTVILHDPFDDPAGFEPRADSPEPTKENQPELLDYCFCLRVQYRMLGLVAQFLE